MPIPALTTDYSDAKAELTKFFFDRSVNALERSIEHMIDANFYQSLLKKLKDGVDFSDEIPVLKTDTGKQMAPAIVQRLSDDATAALSKEWELNAGAAKVFSTSVRSHIADDSNIPCFDVEYSAESHAGAVKVHVTTWRRNVEIKVSGTEKAADAVSKKLLMAGMH